MSESITIQLTELILLILSLIFGIIIFCALMDYAYVSDSDDISHTINIYSSAWKNAQSQATFVDKVEYSIDSEGYGVFRIYIGDKLDYLDCIWNIQYIKEISNE